jgi:hypothetical protein
VIYSTHRFVLLSTTDSYADDGFHSEVAMLSSLHS